MTAEVALLNKSAVALAADSAMTLVGAGKIYPANKVFALSKHNPVGIMIYNNTEFMGVPWETLIKRYRSSIGSESKGTIREYVKHFMDCINTPGVSSDQQQEINLFRIAHDNFAIIRDATREDLSNIIQTKKRFSTRDEIRVIRKATEARLRTLSASAESTSMADVNAAEILSDYRDKVDEQIAQVFVGFNIPDSTRRLLHRVFRLAIKSNEFPNSPRF